MVNNENVKEYNPYEYLEDRLEQLKKDKGEDLVPTIGAYVTTYIGSVIPIASAIGSTIHNIVINRRIDRIIYFIEALVETLNDISDNMTKEHEAESIKRKIENEDFEFLIFRSLKSVLIEQRKEKIGYYVNLLVNHLSNEENEINKEEIFLELIDDISYIELLVLSFFCSGEVTEWEKSEPEEERIKREELLKKHKIHVDEADLAVTRLEQRGFFTRTGIPTIRHYMQKFLWFQGYLSDLAKSFLEYTTSIPEKKGN